MRARLDKTQTQATRSPTNGSEDGDVIEFFSDGIFTILCFPRHFQRSCPTDVEQHSTSNETQTNDDIGLASRETTHQTDLISATHHISPDLRHVRLSTRPRQPPLPRFLQIPRSAQ